LYQMLSGRLPFEGSAAFPLALSILRESPVPLPATIPDELKVIVARCLARRTDDRFQRAADLRDALEALPMSASSDSHAGASRTVTGAPASPNPEANDALALAMQFMRVQNDLDRAQKQLERALELDPAFAEARRWHAANYVIQVVNGYTNDMSRLYAAEDELRRAEALAPWLASLPSAFAAVYLAQGRKEMIPMAALDRACAGSWPARDAMLGGAILLWRAGRKEPAGDLLRRSLEREPLFAAPRMFLGEILRIEGDAAGAIREQRRVLEQGPDNVSAIHFLTLACLDAGARDEARAVLEAKRNRFGANFLWRCCLGLLLGAEDQRGAGIDATGGDPPDFSR